MKNELSHSQSIFQSIHFTFFITLKAANMIIASCSFKISRCWAVLLLWFCLHSGK